MIHSYSFINLTLNVLNFKSICFTLAKYQISDMVLIPNVNGNCYNYKIRKRDSLMMSIPVLISFAIFDFSSQIKIKCGVREWNNFNFHANFTQIRFDFDILQTLRCLFNEQ